MALPEYQACMLPLLRLAADGKEHPVEAVYAALAEHFALTDAERAALLPSGRQPIFENRIGWAKTYLKKAGLLEYPSRGVIRITARGKELLRSNPSAISSRDLEQYPEFLEFRNRTNNAENETQTRQTSTPEELIEEAYLELRTSLASELLSRVKSCSPSFFERLVVDLLVAMGYGGSRRDAGRAVGRSGDGGIDGIINEDRLGLDVVYIQAKRWEHPVGRPEIQKFVGALSGHRARKGVFITTSAFTSEAKEYVSRVDSRIVLIDGVELANFMLDHGIGVAPHAAYEVKRIDSDYFVEG